MNYGQERHVYTFGRAEIEDRIDVAEPYALISISTPPRGEQAHLFAEDMSSATLPADEFRLGVLRLRFDDTDVWPQGLTDLERAYVGLYSPEMAAQVAAYVRAYAGASIVVHCDAGISRSQGMALAIAEHRGVVPRNHTRGWPNRLVYRLTYQALRPGEASGPVAARLKPKSPIGGIDVTIPEIKPKTGRDNYRIRFTDPYKVQ